MVKRSKAIFEDGRDAARKPQGGGDGCVMVIVFAGTAAVYVVGRFFGWWA